MPYYFYDPISFEYRGSMAASGTPGASLPDNATLDAPENRPGCAPFWSTETNAWEYVEDHRGETAFAIDRSSVLLIETVGSLPEGFTTKKTLPLKNGHEIVWDGDDWKYIEDHRGKIGYINGGQVTIEDLGDLPEGWSDEPPPPPPYEPPPDTRTPKEKRESAYRRVTDPICDRIDGYKSEAEALRMSGREEEAKACDTKASELLQAFLAAKEAIRAEFPEE